MDIFFSNISNIAHLFAQIASVGAKVWFFVLPIMLFPLFMYVWMNHIITKYLTSVQRVMLEIIPPKDIEKSPQLMEGLFDGIAGSDKSYPIYESHVQGIVPPTFSFEIVGGEGRVHFYIRTPVIMRNLIEAHLYAQYPDVQIVEVDDYVNEVPKNIPNDEWNLWGADFQLTRPDAYPIKTYHYFEESVTGKMIDPMAGLIEVMGKLAPGQKLWLQYIISPERSSTWYDKEGKALMDELTKGKPEKKPGVMSMLMSGFGGFIGSLMRALTGTPDPEEKKSDAKKDLGPIEFRLTPVQRKVLEAIETNIGKNVFKVKMRFMYLGRRENYNSGGFLAAFFGAMKPYNDSNLNSLIPHGGTKTSMEYVFMKSRLIFAQRRLFRRYCDRDRYPTSNIFVLSSSEMATLFHLPDGSIVSPALTRVSAKRGSSPSNLPI